MPSTLSSNGRPAGETSEARIAKALAHPLRAQILQRLGERVSSPGDLADELGAPLGVVSYHVRMLRDYNCVELVRTEPVRGALQHFYKATARPNFDDAQWRTLPSQLRRELAGETIQELVKVKQKIERDKPIAGEPSATFEPDSDAENFKRGTEFTEPVTAIYQKN